MARYFAFLRAINVGGHTVTMARLKEIFAAENLAKVTTYLAAGNVSFETRAAPAAVEQRLERRLYQELGYEVATFVRSDAELLAAHAHQPYTPREVGGAHTLCIGFMRAPLTRSALAAVSALGNDVDQYRANGRELYHLCQRGLSESTVTGRTLERALGQPVTMRNVKTIAKLAAACGTS